MRSFDDWMNEYAKDHKNPINQKIHLVCVPLILFSILGLLWNLQWPQNQGSSLLNGATLFILASLIFYARLNFKYALAMAIFVFPMVLLMFYGSQSSHYTFSMLVIFILAWIGQFIGHKIEGQKPSFFKDIQFLMIGPLWVVKKLINL